MEGFEVTFSILVSFASIVVHSFHLPLLGEIQYNLNPILSILLTFFLFIPLYYHSGGWHGG